MDRRTFIGGVAGGLLKLASTAKRAADARSLKEQEGEVPRA